jgi:hypothetical protein
MFNKRDMEQVHDSSTFSVPAPVCLSARRISDESTLHRLRSDLWVGTADENVGTATNLTKV